MRVVPTYSRLHPGHCSVQAYRTDIPKARANPTLTSSVDHSRTGDYLDS